jgi:hypothetical protein
LFQNKTTSFTHIVTNKLGTDYGKNIGLNVETVFNNKANNDSKQLGIKVISTINEDILTGVSVGKTREGKCCIYTLMTFVVAALFSVSLPQIHVFILGNTLSILVVVGRESCTLI